MILFGGNVLFSKFTNNIALYGANWHHPLFEPLPDVNK
jgi:hypothetical protein